MAQVAEIKFAQQIMEKETEKKISEIDGLFILSKHGLLYNRCL